jgi:hypothetical protein
MLEYLECKGVTAAKPIERRTAQSYRRCGPTALRYLDEIGWVVPNKPRQPRPPIQKETAAQVAVEEMRKARRTELNWNDRMIILRIAKRLGLPLEWGVEQHVFDTIDRTNQGDLVKTFAEQACGHGHRRRCRRFVFPEAAKKKFPPRHKPAKQKTAKKLSTAKLKI